MRASKIAELYLMRPVKRYFKGSIGTPLGVLQGCAIRFPLEDLDRQPCGSPSRCPTDFTQTPEP